jgi:hypothetical protein
VPHRRPGTHSPFVGIFDVFVETACSGYPHGKVSKYLTNQTS